MDCHLNMSLLSLPKRYSEACHKAYYTSGMAPELLTCEWMYVVIMELLEKYSSLFSLAQEQKLSQLVEEKVIESVKKMHSLGLQT